MTNLTQTETARYTDDITDEEDEIMNKTYITEIDGKWYAFAGDPKDGQVYSIGRDNPTDGGTWTARWTDSGIKYVAHPSPSRAAAYSKARRNGDYNGEV